MLCCSSFSVDHGFGQRLTGKASLRNLRWLRKRKKFVCKILNVLATNEVDSIKCYSKFSLKNGLSALFSEEAKLQMSTKVYSGTCNV